MRVWLWHGAEDGLLDYGHMRATQENVYELLSQQHSQPLSRTSVLESEPEIRNQIFYKTIPLSCHLLIVLNPLRKASIKHASFGRL